MALKCYTKPRKNGSKYTTCNKDIKENKSHSRSSRTRPSAMSWSLSART